MLARTPAPWTRSTGPFRGVSRPRTWIRLQARPSPAVNGTTRSVHPRASPRSGPGWAARGMRLLIAGDLCRGEGRDPHPGPMRVYPGARRKNARVGHIEPSGAMNLEAGSDDAGASRAPRNGGDAVAPLGMSGTDLELLEPREPVDATAIRVLLQLPVVQRAHEHAA